MANKRSGFDRALEEAHLEGKTYAQLQKERTIAEYGHVNIADVMDEINKKEKDDGIKGKDMGDNRQDRDDSRDK